jgi:hypothetical protein
MLMVFANLLEDNGASTCSVVAFKIVWRRARGKIACYVHCVSIVRHVNWKTHLSVGNTRVLGSS